MPETLSKHFPSQLPDTAAEDFGCCCSAEELTTTTVAELLKTTGVVRLLEEIAGIVALERTGTVALDAGGRVVAEEAGIAGATCSSVTTLRSAVLISKMGVPSKLVAVPVNAPVSSWVKVTWAIVWPLMSVMIPVG